MVLHDGCARLHSVTQSRMHGLLNASDSTQPYQLQPP